MSIVSDVREDRSLDDIQMKLATWNVNGIRARQANLQEFIER